MSVANKTDMCLCVQNAYIDGLVKAPRCFVPLGTLYTDRYIHMHIITVYSLENACISQTLLQHSIFLYILLGLLTENLEKLYKTTSSS